MGWRYIRNGTLFLCLEVINATSELRITNTIQPLLICGNLCFIFLFGYGAKGTYFSFLSLEKPHYVWWATALTLAGTAAVFSQQRVTSHSQTELEPKYRICQGRGIVVPLTSSGVSLGAFEGLVTRLRKTHQVRFQTCWNITVSWCQMYKAMPAFVVSVGSKSEFEPHGSLSGSLPRERSWSSSLSLLNQTNE